MKLTKQRLKQIIKEELKTLSESHDHGPYPQTPEQLKDWTSGFTGDPNDPLPSTVARRAEDLEAAKTLVSAMAPEELRQLQQHISELSDEADASSSEEGDDASGGEGAGDGPYSFMSHKDIEKQRLAAMKRRRRMLDMLPTGASE
tara:strand:+ start:2568 stop:3002 length:435 start_codon:yes stop_codon:yes gene_type:complete